MLVNHSLKTKKKYIQDLFIQNKLDKTRFQRDMAYEDFKDLPGISMIDINVDLLECFSSFLIKVLLVVVLKVKLYQNND